MLNFFLFSLLIYGSIELVVFLAAIAVEAFEDMGICDFDWEIVGDVTGFTAAMIAPIFVFVNLVKFFTIAYYWFF